MSQDRMNAQLKGLEHPSALFRRQAAFGVFALLRSQPAAQQSAVQGVLLACLTNRHADVVDESLRQLLQLLAPGPGHSEPAGLTVEGALHLLLLALTTAGAATAPLLAAGLVPLCQLLIRSVAADSDALAAVLARQFPAGSRHPLCSGLLSHPAAAAALITAAVNWLAAAAAVPEPAGASAAAAGGSTSAGPPPGLSVVWSVLRPFFSYVLLADAAGDSSSSSSQAEPPGGGSGGVGAAATSMCLSQLLCLCSCSPAAAQLLLPFLLRQLLLWRLGAAAGRSALIQALSDILDVLAAHAPEDDTDINSHDTDINSSSSSSWCWWRRCCQDVGSLLLLLAMRAAAPVAAGGSSGGAAAMPLLLPLLWRLGGELAPGLLQQQLLPLGWLLVVVQSQQDQAAVMQLISAQLRPGRSGQAHPQQQLAAVEPWQAAALHFPLLQQLVFSTRKQNKAWAAALLAQLKRQQQQQQQGAAVPAAAGRQASSAFQLWSAQGPLANVAAVQQLLAAWWSEDGASSSGSSTTLPVLTWLDSFTSSLQLLSQRPGGSTAAAAAGQPGGSGSSALTLPLAPASVIRDLEGAGDDESEALPSVLMSTGAAAWCSSAGVSPSMQLLLAALLQHPQRRVVPAAASALQQLLLLVPTAAPAFLPLVLQQLRAAATAGAAGCTTALLQLLPAMCVDPSSSALVWKILQPVAAVTAPPSHTRQVSLAGRQVSATGSTNNGLARSVAVQLAVQAWQLTGRGWNRAEAAVNGCMRPPGAGGVAAAAAAAAAEPLELRLLRATAMSDVMCSGTAGPRSLELLGSLAEALRDPAPAVAAAALRGLAALLADDDLDFYAAWPVLTRTLLAAAGPKAALAAVGADGSGGGGSRLCPPGSAVAGWVGLLRFGADDAAVQPELAGAVVAVMQLAAAAADPRVRAAAYSSLSCWPLPLLAELELSPTAAEYIAPLAAEAAAAAAAASRSQPHQQGSGRRQQQLLLKANRAAMAAAELLAAAAIRHEHANRRQFLAAATRGSSSSSSSSTGPGPAAGSSGSNAAAVEREEAALRHRLTRVLPAALTSSAATAAGDAAAAGAPSAGALLLLWQPEASSSSSSSNSYQQVLGEVSSRWAPDAAAGCAGVAAGPGLSDAAWAAFMCRWCAVPGVAPEALLQQLMDAASSALPAAAAAAAAAAAGLAAARVASEGQLEELMRHLTAVIDDNDRPSLVAAAAASSLARLLPVLHPADWTSRERCVSRLYAMLMDCCSSDSGNGSSSSSVEGQVVAAAAAAEALGFAGVTLLQQHQDGSSLFGSSAASDTGGQADRAVCLACSCLGLLLSVLRGLWSGRVVALAAALDQLLLGLPGQQRELVLLQELSLGQEHTSSLQLTANALRSCLALLTALHSKAQHVNSGGTAAATAAAAGGFASFVLDQLAAVASDVTAGGGSSHSSSRLAWQLAVLAAAPAAAGTGLLCGRTSHQQLAAATAHAKAVATAATGVAAGAAEAAALVLDGRLRAAAAVSWAQLVLMGRAAGGSSSSSSSSSGDGQELSGVVSWLAAAATAAPNNAAAKAPGVAATRAGAAAGLAVLLGVDLAAGSCGEWTAAVVAAAAGGGGSGPAPAFSSGGGSSWGLLAPPGSNSLPRLQLVRSCLKALEAAAAVRGGGGGSTAAHAGWLLAAACVAAGSRVAGRPGAAAGRQRQQAAAAGPVTALPMLPQYPAAGALRPLAERALAFNPASALTPAPGDSATALAAALEVAAAVRCLAGAPRLPAADWAGLCRRLIAAGGCAPAAAGAAAAAALQLQEAAVLLLLSHCQAPGLELTGVLDALLDPSGFRQLQPYVQGLVLGQLGRLLAALPAARGVVLLRGLPALVADLAAKLGLGRAAPAAPAAGSGSGQGRAGSSRDGVVVFLAAWAGLTQLAEAAAAQAPPFVGQQQQRQLAAVLQGAVQGLLLLLPPLQLPCSGLLLQVVRADVAAALGQLQEQQQLLHAWGVADSCPDTSGSGGSGSDAAGSLQQQQQLLANDDALLLWSGAVGCLCSLHTDSLLQVTEVPAAAPDPPPAAGLAAGGTGSLHAAVQARCLLVLANKLSWKDLAAARNAFLTSADPGQGDPGSTAALLLLPLSLACATAPQAGLLQQLQELAAAAGVGPAAASRGAALAAGVLAAWLVSTGPGSAGSQPPGAAAGGSAAAALTAAAAALAERQLALGNSGSSTAVLAQLPALLPQLLASHHLAGSRQGFAEAVCAALLTIAAAGSREAAAAVRAAVAAVREALPQVGSRCWQQLMRAAAAEES